MDEIYPVFIYPADTIYPGLRSEIKLIQKIN